MSGLLAVRHEEGVTRNDELLATAAAGALSRSRQCTATDLPTHCPASAAHRVGHLLPGVRSEPRLAVRIRLRGVTAVQGTRKQGFELRSHRRPLGRSDPPDPIPVPLAGGEGGDRAREDGGRCPAPRVRDKPCAVRVLASTVVALATATPLLSPPQWPQRPGGSGHGVGAATAANASRRRAWLLSLHSGSPAQHGCASRRSSQGRHSTLSSLRPAVPRDRRSARSLADSFQFPPHKLSTHALA